MHLVIDLRWALVHDQQRHIIFAQFTGDGGEGRLGRHLAVEELVRLLHHDDQLARLGFAMRAELVGLVLPGRCGSCGSAGSRRAGNPGRFRMSAERQHHVLSVLERLDDLRGRCPRRASRRYTAC